MRYFLLHAHQYSKRVSLVDCWLSFSKKEAIHICSSILIAAFTQHFTIPIRVLYTFKFTKRNNDRKGNLAKRQRSEGHAPST